MARQLALLEPPNADWRLDDGTRTKGRQGIAAARAVLATVRRPSPTEGPECPPPAAA